MLAQVIPIVRNTPKVDGDKDRREPILSFMGERMADLDSNGSIESLSDISKMLRAQRGKILGHLALSLIKNRFADLLTQEYSAMCFRWACTR